MAVKLVYKKKKDVCRRQILSSFACSFNYLKNLFKGSGKSCFTGVLSLVYFEGLDLCSALLPHQPPGVDHPLHKLTVSFPSGQSALGGCFG